MWALVTKTDERKKKDPNAPRDHSYLILSREESAFILKTEEEISELEDSGFNTTDKTIFAGNIGNDKFIVQVSNILMSLNKMFLFNPLSNEICSDSNWLL